MWKGRFEKSYIIFKKFGNACIDADMKAVMVYRADSVRGGYTGFDFKIRDINIAKLVDFIPSMDTIVPMLRSLKEGFSLMWLQRHVWIQI